MRHTEKHERLRPERRERWAEPLSIPCIRLASIVPTWFVCACLAFYGAGSSVPYDRLNVLQLAKMTRDIGFFIVRFKKWCKIPIMRENHTTDRNYAADGCIMLDTNPDLRKGKGCKMQEDLLMAKIAQGDEDSFAQLYELWRRRIMAYAFRSLRDIHEAQDVMQETFLQLYKAAPTYRCEGKFGAFVFRIAGNLVRERGGPPRGSAAGC